MTFARRDSVAQHAQPLVLASLAIAAQSGCAATAHNPQDALESLNRTMFALNEKFDRAVAKPVAKTYQKVVLRPVRGWLRN